MDALDHGRSRRGAPARRGRALRVLQLRRRQGARQAVARHDARALGGGHRHAGTAGRNVEDRKRIARALPRRGDALRSEPYRGRQHESRDGIDEAHGNVAHERDVHSRHDLDIERSRPARRSVPGPDHGHRRLPHRHLHADEPARPRRGAEGRRAEDLRGERHPPTARHDEERHVHAHRASHRQRDRRPGRRADHLLRLRHQQPERRPRPASATPDSSSSCSSYNRADHAPWARQPQLILFDNESGRGCTVVVDTAIPFPCWILAHDESAANRRRSEQGFGSVAPDPGSAFENASNAGESVHGNNRFPQVQRRESASRNCLEAARDDPRHPNRCRAQR